MALTNINNLKRYLALNFNVLFTGKHGVGKTSILSKTFEDEGIKWKYFSAATMDPWTELVGIPENVNGELEFIRPKSLDEYDAIFFDELNRAPDKVLNAIMELIQFKSINGRKFPKLRVVWAAINPPDEEDTYKVNTLDPAQLDRFQVQIEIPYELDTSYFKSKYGKMAEFFCQWWKELPDDIKTLVSPRRLEYAMIAQQSDCRLEDFLPAKSNVKKLRLSLKSLGFIEQLTSIEAQNVPNFLSNVNNVTKLLDFAKNNDPIASEFVQKHQESIPQEFLRTYSGVVKAVDSKKIPILSARDLFDKIYENQYKLNLNEAKAYINSLDFSTLSTNALTNAFLAEKLQNPSQAKEMMLFVTDSFLKTRPAGKDAYEIPPVIGAYRTIEIAGQKTTSLFQLIEIMCNTKFFMTQSRVNRINNVCYNKQIVPNMNHFTYFN
jgi:hypothetical protein